MTDYSELIKKLRNRRVCIQSTGNLNDYGLLAEAAEAISALQSDLKCCRNELCLHCGQYKTAHLGSCAGCRWRNKG